jgi:hypothetical protein
MVMVSVVMVFITRGSISWRAITLIIALRLLLLVFMGPFLFLVLLVLMLQHVRSDGADNASCQRSEHATADLVGQESSAGAAD